MARDKDKSEPIDPQRRYSKPRRIGKTARAVALPALRKRGFAEARIATRWPEIIGQDLANQTLPEKLTRGQGGGTLTLRASGAAALELTYLTPQILERINTYFGFQAVARLRLVQGPIPARPKSRFQRRRALNEAEAAQLDTWVAEVRSTRLKDALADLGHGILTAPDR